MGNRTNINNINLEEFLSRYLDTFKRIQETDPDKAKQLAIDSLLRAGIIEIVDGDIKVKTLVEEQNNEN